MLRVMLWGASCLVLTVVVAFGLLREDRYVLAIGAVGWALAAAQFAGRGGGGSASRGGGYMPRRARATVTFGPPLRLTEERDAGSVTSPTPVGVVGRR